MPVNGRCPTPAQRHVYELVLAAQKAGIEAARVGAEFMAPTEPAIWPFWPPDLRRWGS
jgi:Xaa-Pro aminopeptidase